jgi:cysteine desulfurase/selenocysteine lyase
VAQKLNSDPLQFPIASGPSPQAAADELIETFEFLGDWEQRHQYLIDEGDKLLPMLPEMKTEAHRVRGCMSTVHLVTRKKPGTADTMEFLADSDAAIVRGLISILQRVYSGQTAKAILAFDIEGLLKHLGLDQQLSMGRRNGLSSMIERIRTEATNLTAQGK